MDYAREAQALLDIEVLKEQIRTERVSLSGGGEQILALIVEGDHAAVLHRECGMHTDTFMEFSSNRTAGRFCGSGHLSLPPGQDR